MNILPSNPKEYATMTLIEIPLLHRHLPEYRIRLTKTELQLIIKLYEHLSKFCEEKGDASVTSQIHSFQAELTSHSNINHARYLYYFTFVSNLTGILHSLHYTHTGTHPPDVAIDIHILLLKRELIMAVLYLLVSTLDIISFITMVLASVLLIFLPHNVTPAHLEYIIIYSGISCIPLSILLIIFDRCAKGIEKQAKNRNRRLIKHFIEESPHVSVHDLLDEYQTSKQRRKKKKGRCST